MKSLTQNWVKHHVQIMIKESKHPSTAFTAFCPDNANFAILMSQRGSMF